MPTGAELEELIDNNNCIWTWTTQNGVNGYKVTSKKNKHSLFLPASGNRFDSMLCLEGTHGRYWSSTPGSRVYACSMDFDEYYVYGSGSGSPGRSFGLSVRLVQDY